MKAIVVTGFVVIAVWLAYLTWRVERLIAVTYATCSYAYQAEKKTEPGREIIFFCPR
jgi:hypothetical protein